MSHRFKLSVNSMYSVALLRYITGRIVINSICLCVILGYEGMSLTKQILFFGKPIHLYKGQVSASRIVVKEHARHRDEFWVTFTTWKLEDDCIISSMETYII